VPASQTADAAPPHDAVLVRLTAEVADWASLLPPAPAGWTLTVGLGHPAMLPIPHDDLRARGYEVVGVASSRAPVGHTIDVLVPAALRLAAPRWWDELAGQATRIFDLRMGPVLALLGSQLALHERAAARR
jgi:hypothetical protein